MTKRLAVAMLACDMRLYLRRTSTFVVTLALVGMSWLIIVDPAGGSALLVVGTARGIYNSVCLAMGSSLLAGLVFPLAGFYLLRGRTKRDMLYGAGGVLAATPVGNAALILWRWLGGVAYLCAFLLLLTLTMLALQAVRGEGPVEPLVFIQFHVLAILPGICFAASMALAFDAHPRLMGRRGDVLYFVVWMMQCALAQNLGESAFFGSGSPLHVLDVTGVGMITARAHEIFHTSQFNIGISEYDRDAVPVVMGDGYWTWLMSLLRLAATALALLPLWFAVRVFHRYSPDLVEASGVQRRGEMMGRMNRRLRSAGIVPGTLLVLAGRVKGHAGGVVAEVALTLTIYPLALLVWNAVILSACFVDYASLKGVLLFAILFWGILISNFGRRDEEAGMRAMCAALPGGDNWRYFRQYLASVLLGLLLTGPVLIRLALHAPIRAAALAGGIFALASIAHVLALLTRTSRVFLALFLCTTYIALQADTVAALDVGGINSVATPLSIAAELACGLLLLAAGAEFNRRREPAN